MRPRASQLPRDYALARGRDRRACSMGWTWSREARGPITGTFFFVQSALLRLVDDPRVARVEHLLAYDAQAGVAVAKTCALLSSGLCLGGWAPPVVWIFM